LKIYAFFKAQADVAHYALMLTDLAFRLLFHCGVQKNQLENWQTQQSAAANRDTIRVRRFVEDEPGTPGAALLKWFGERLSARELVRKPALTAQAQSLFSATMNGATLPAGWVDRWMARNSVRAFTILRRTSLSTGELIARVRRFHAFVNAMWATHGAEIDVVLNFDEVPWSLAGVMATKTLGVKGHSAEQTLVAQRANDSKRCGSLFVLVAWMRTGATRSPLAPDIELTLDDEWQPVRMPYAFLAIKASEPQAAVYRYAPIVEPYASGDAAAPVATEATRTPCRTRTAWRRTTSTRCSPAARPPSIAVATSSA
jgi:hypothetical protein